MMAVRIISLFEPFWVVLSISNAFRWVCFISSVISWLRVTVVRCVRLVFAGLWNRLIFSQASVSGRVCRRGKGGVLGCWVSDIFCG